LTSWWRRWRSLAEANIDAFKGMAGKVAPEGSEAQIPLPDGWTKPPLYWMLVAD
jgi:hypothetical protein